MSDIEIKGRITVDSGNSVKSTTELEQAVRAASKAVKDAKIGSKEYIEAQSLLKKSTNELTTATSGGSGSFSKLKETLSNTVPGFKVASEGASSFGMRLKELAANPLVLILTAIVGVLTFLYKSFTSTAEGGKKMEQVFAGIQAVIQVLTDRLFSLGNAVIKFFSGDFKGAAADAKASVSGIGDEIERVYTKTAKLTQRLQEIRKEERADDLDKAEREKRLALLREQLNDDSVPIAKRKAAAKELRADQEKNAVDDLRRAKEKAAIQISLYTQEKDGAKKHADEINEINIGILNTEKENTLEMVRTNKVIRNLDNQEAQVHKEATDAIKAKEKEQKEKDDKKRQDGYNAIAKAANDANADQMALINSMAEFKAEMDLVDQKRKDDIAETDRIRTEQGIAYNKAVIAEKKQAETDLLNHKKAVQSETEALLANGMAVFGRQTILGKGLQAAQALMNTYTGATEALRAKSALPSPFDVVAKIANVAAVLATGFKAVKGINAVQVPGASGGGISPGDLSAPAPLSPQATSTILNSGSIQGIGNAANGGATRAFVLDKDIKNNAERDALINRAARLA